MNQVVVVATGWELEPVRHDVTERRKWTGSSKAFAEVERKPRYYLNTRVIEESTGGEQRWATMKQVLTLALKINDLEANVVGEGDLAG